MKALHVFRVLLAIVALIGVSLSLTVAMHHKETLFQQSRRIDVIAEFGCGEAVELVCLGLAARAQVHG